TPITFAHPCLLSYFFHASGYHRVLLSFPTRRSSDLSRGRSRPPRPPRRRGARRRRPAPPPPRAAGRGVRAARTGSRPYGSSPHRSEEHTSELQSRENLVCRLLLEKKKKRKRIMTTRL